MIERDEARSQGSRWVDATPRPLEAAIADACAEVMGLAQVDVEADFLGLVTDSIHIIQVVSRLRETIHPDLPLRLFYIAPTISDIAREVEQFLITAPAATDDTEEGEL